MPESGWFKLKLTKVKSSNNGLSLIIIINNGRQCTFSINFNEVWRSWLSSEDEIYPRSLIFDASSAALLLSKESHSEVKWSSDLARSVLLPGGKTRPCCHLLKPSSESHTNPPILCLDENFYFDTLHQHSSFRGKMGQSKKLIKEKCKKKGRNCLRVRNSSDLNDLMTNASMCSMLTVLITFHVQKCQDD